MSGRDTWDDALHLAFSEGAPRPGFAPGDVVAGRRIVRELGRGGMGTVYLAEDPDGAAPVALKALHPHLLERPGFFARFQREAEAGLRVDHENVVRTLEARVERVGEATHGLLVMEYVRGRTLRAMLREWGSVPEALVREIAGQVAAGLDAIHAAGIVHRDLKPENLLVTDDHEVRIMDLGVAHLAEADTTLTKEGQFAGTLAYAAPEQFTDGAVSPATDLYALGIVLYELMTGVNPFQRAEPEAAMYAHLETMPKTLQVLAPEVSPLLSDLVSTLLGKRPEDRFPSARDLARVLEEGERAAWWTEREKARPRPRLRVPRVPVRRETGMYGREEALALLCRTWAESRAGSGGVVLLEGEAGIGKSRLVDAFLRDLEGDEIRVLYGSYAPTGGWGGIADAVLAHIGHVDLEDGLGRWLPDHARLVPALAALLRRDAPPEDAIAFSDDAFRAVLAALMRAWAADRPLVWVVEDLHFADADSRRLLLALARALQDLPVLLLLTARPLGPDPDLVLLGQQVSLRRLALARLGPADVTHLLTDVLHDPDLAARLSDHVLRRSDGVPLFVFELLRTWREGGFLEEQPDGRWVEAKAVDEAAVPSMVQDLIEVRLRHLERDERSLLDAAAVAGFEIDVDLLARALGLRRIEVLQLLTAVERKAGVVRAAGTGFRFDHHQVLETLYASLPEALRREYHTLLADAFAEREGLGDVSPEDVPGDATVILATHGIRGRRPADGVPFLEAAMQHLGRLHRRQAVLALGREALAHEGLLKGVPRGRALLRTARHLKSLGRAKEGRPLIEEARAEAERVGDRPLLANAVQTLGLNLFATSELDAAERALVDALALGQETGDAAIEARAHIGTGHVCLSGGRFEEGRAHYEQARDIAVASGNAMEEASASGALGAAAWHVGTPVEALGHYEEELRLSRAAGYAQGEASALINLGMVLNRLGRRDEARVRFEEALRFNREIGRHEGESSCLRGLGGILGRQGSYEEAASYHQRAVDLAVRTGRRSQEAQARTALGSRLALLGRCDEAREQLTRAVALGAEVKSPHDEGVAVLVLAGLDDQEGRVEEAWRLAQQARALLQKKKDGPDDPRVLGLLGHLEAKRGHVDAAVSHLEAAMEIAGASDARTHYLLAASMRAALEGEGAEEPAALAEEYGDGPDHDSRLEVRYHLWRATGDEEHLEEARRLLEFVYEHASKEHRPALIENVPHHREIWKASGKLGP